MTRKSKRAKALDITPKVKQIVWERDGMRCVTCGDSQAMPNSHYIARNDMRGGGLGIEQNVVTQCRVCHQIMDFGTEVPRYEMKARVKEYLQSQYEDWNEEDLRFRKGM